MALADCLTGLQHIGIPTDDIGESIRFYESLGFSVAYRTVNEAAGEAVAFLTMKGLTLEVYENKAAVLKTGAIDHIALDVCDIEAAFRQIKEGGYTLLTDEIQSLPFWEKGVRFFIIEGPNREKVEFCQRL